LNDNLKKVSKETVKFIRGKYYADEIGDGNKLEFIRDGIPFITVYVHNDRYDIHINGECISVSCMETLEAAKTLILSKHEPNRKPFSKENAVYAECGHRCDFCVHYTYITEELRGKLHKHICSVYSWDSGKEIPKCGGCSHGGLNAKFDCHQRKCSKERGIPLCRDCANHCDKATAGWAHTIEDVRNISADDVTWAILPYTRMQYGN
jgi:hypothetical protein